MANYQRNRNLPIPEVVPPHPEPEPHYQGYRNWETWVTELWLDNDYGMYTAKQDFISQGNITPQTVESFVTNLMPEGTPDFDSPAEYENVDWQELSDLWNEEYRDSYGEEE